MDETFFMRRAGNLPSRDSQSRIILNKGQRAKAVSGLGCRLLGPVKTKRQVAVPGVLLPGEAHKRGNTLAVLTLLGNKAWRQKNGTLKARVADAQGQRCSFGLVVL